MSPIFAIIVAALAVAQLVIPQRYAFVPILLAAFNLGNVEILGELTPVRILILAGFVRIICTGLLNIDFRNPIDRLILMLSFLTILSSPFHNDSYGNPYIYRFGLVYNIAGVYYIGKAFLAGADISKRFAIGSLIAISPLSILMLLEVTSGRNFYYPHLGASSAYATFREGFRAKGPFGHAILAGTAGASSIALFIPYWKENRKLAVIGILVATIVVISSNSSGPIAAMMFSIGIIFGWRWRKYLPHSKAFLITGIIALSLYMDRPFYFIIDSIDFTGGSTGWFRARLIQSSLEHFSEWWLFGTDYTRHWMATGVSWNPNHTDMVNYYLHLGVIGGLPLSITLVLIVWVSAKRLINAIYALEYMHRTKEAFFLWTLLAALASHASSFVSISYFDQMYVVFYLLIALIANLSLDTLTNTSEPSSKTTN